VQAQKQDQSEQREESRLAKGKADQCRSKGVAEQVPPVPGAPMDDPEQMDRNRKTGKQNRKPQQPPHLLTEELKRKNQGKRPGRISHDAANWNVGASPPCALSASRRSYRNGLAWWASLLRRGPIDYVVIIAWSLCRQQKIADLRNGESKRHTADGNGKGKKRGGAKNLPASTRLQARAGFIMAFSTVSQDWLWRILKIHPVTHLRCPSFARYQLEQAPRVDGRLHVHTGLVQVQIAFWIGRIQEVSGLHRITCLY